jgi:hypothetical protein
MNEMVGIHLYATPLNQRMEFNETVRDSLVIHDIADLLLCLPFE